MVSKLSLMLVFVLVAVLVIPISLQDSFAESRFLPPSESGFSPVQKSTGVKMMFCSNHALTPQECEEKYDGYTWTDRVNVLIYAPGWNTEENIMEKIGQSENNEITISTRDGTVDTAVFTETGPDTGVFFGVVKLTGQHYTVHDQNDIEIKAHGHLSSNVGIIGSGQGCETSSGGHGHGFLIPLVMQMKGLLFSAVMIDFIPEAHAQMHGHMPSTDQMHGHMPSTDQMHGHMPSTDQMHGHMQSTPTCSTVGITGSALDVAARLPTDFQEGAVTVSWEANEDVVLTKSATWSWRIGEIEFDKNEFSVNEPIKFTLHDRDLWIHHAEFFTYWMHVYSDSDQAGIYVPVQFMQNHDHGSEVEYTGVKTKLSEPAASSLTKYTPEGKWKMYFWWSPGGVIGIDQDYDLNLMVHDGLTDIHQLKLYYNMEIWLNGELLEVRTEGFADDGHAVETVNFDQRGSVKIVFTDLFGSDIGNSFSFQVAPEAILKDVVPRHHAFDTVIGELEGRYGTHYIDKLDGEFSVTLDEESQELDMLHVSHGDTITVEYTDMTVPKPFVTSDDLDIKARTVVYDQPIGLVNADELLEEESTITETSFLKSSEGIKRIQDTKTRSSITSVSAEISIPTWVKKNASWWSDGQINDPDFAKGIEYMIQENIIDVPRDNVDVDEELANITSIPMWVRSNASWWSEGLLTDVEFANGLKYLISNGLIKV